MMRIKLLLFLTASALLLPAAVAQACFMPVWEARHETRQFSRETCEEDHYCVSYEVGYCERRSPSRVNCLSTNYSRDRHGEMECDMLLRWGVSPDGYVILKSYASPHCYYL